MGMIMNGDGGFMTLVPLMIISIPLAYGGWWIAPKLGASRVLWMVLFLIPVVNWFATTVLCFKVAGAILDKLNALTKSN